MRHESGAEEVERNKRIQNMMMRPSEIQAAFQFAAYGFLGNPLHLQGVLFMMGVPTHTLYPCQQRGFFISAPIILFAAFPFPWLRQISSYGGAGSSNAPAFV